MGELQLAKREFDNRRPDRGAWYGSLDVMNSGYSDRLRSNVLLRSDGPLGELPKRRGKEGCCVVGVECKQMASTPTLHELRSSTRVTHFACRKHVRARYS